MSAGVARCNLQPIGSNGSGERRLAENLALPEHEGMERQLGHKGSRGQRSEFLDISFPRIRCSVAAIGIVSFGNDSVCLDVVL